MASCGGKATAGVDFSPPFPPRIDGATTTNRTTLMTLSVDQQAWVALVLTGGVLGCLAGGYRVVLGTTLLAAWIWGLVAVAVVGGVEAALGFAGMGEGPAAESARYAAVAALFCPGMALLGAKRPQNTAWQFVVVTLWGILALPALEVWLRGRGEPLSLHTVWSWFQVVLIAVGLFNHLPTRFCPAATSLAVAETFFLWPHLPWGELMSGSDELLRALGFVALGVAGGLLRFRSRPLEREAGIPEGEFARWNVIWRDFRDWFGVVWSLRVMERVNASATMYGWAVVLGWDGFRRKSAAQASDEAEVLAVSEFTAIEQSLRTLLRRFVSPDWIERRLKAARTDD
jgi:hypothetical protein